MVRPEDEFALSLMERLYDAEAEVASLAAIRERAEAALASERAYDPHGEALERIEFILGVPAGQETR